MLRKITTLKSSQAISLLVIALLHSVPQTSGNFPSEWVTTERCTYHFGWECVGSTCFVVCYQYESSAVIKSWPAFQRFGQNIFGAITFSFEDGSGNSSSFYYLDNFENRDYRCSHGSLQSGVFLLKELETGITVNTTIAECEISAVNQLNAKIMPIFSEPGNEDSFGATSSCPLPTAEYAMEYTPFGGAQACSFTDGAVFNVTGDQFTISFCNGVSDSDKTVSGVVLDATDFFCVDSFSGEFINGDSSEALVYYYDSGEQYGTDADRNGILDLATRLQYQGIRFTNDGRGNYAFSMYLGGNTNDTSFLYDHTATTTGQDYATFNLYHCANYECPGETRVCLLESERCDTVENCQDGSDELACDAATCSGFLCASSMNLQCIPSNKTCDSVNDCLNGEDEADNLCKCCNVPSDLTGTWYWGRAVQLVNNNRPFYKYVIPSDGCTTTSDQVYNDPAVTTPDVTLQRSCEMNGAMINGNFYYVDVLTALQFGWICISLSSSSAGDLRFQRQLLPGGWSASSTPEECQAAIGDSTSFLVMLRLPLVNSSSPVTVPWAAEDMDTSWQATVHLNASTTACSDDAASTFTLLTDSIQMNLCQETGIPSSDVTGIDERSSSMRVLRTWTGSEMAGLGDDSLGTFLLLALNDQTQLDANTPHLFVARFLKKGVGNYTLAIDWTYDNNYAVDAAMNPETAYTLNPNTRVYELTTNVVEETSTIAMPTETSTDSMPEGTDVTDMPDASDASNMPDASDASDMPDGSDMPDASDMSNAIDASNMPDDSDASDMPDATNASDMPDASDASDMPDESDMLDASDASDIPDDSDMSDDSDMPDASDASDMPDASDDASDMPDASDDASDMLDASDDASDMPDASDDASDMPDASDDASDMPDASDDASDMPDASDDASDMPDASDASDMPDATQATDMVAPSDQTVSPGASEMPAGSQSIPTPQMSDTSQPTVGQMATTDGGVQPTNTIPTGQMTTTPGDMIQPTTTSTVPDSSATIGGEVGIANIAIDGDFDNITAGDPSNFCQQTEGQIAETANVTADRVDNVECVSGSVKITTHISEGGPGETTIEQALDNLRAAIEAGLMIRGPSGQMHPTLPGEFKEYIRGMDGVVRCRGDTCDPPEPVAVYADDDNDALIYSLVGVGVFIVILTIIAVVVCAMRREEPSSFKKLPFEEEDGFGFVTQWQAEYKMSSQR